jgi:quaternary ammonium compound-resistance protein SugE
MELLFVVLIAAGLGFLAHYAIPGRETRGSILLGAISASVAAAIWVSLLWLGFTFDGGWIWVISLVAAGVAALIVAIALPPRRRASDRELLARLSGGKA